MMTASRRCATAGHGTVVPTVMLAGTRLAGGVGCLGGQGKGRRGAGRRSAPIGDLGGGGERPWWWWQLVGASAAAAGEVGGLIGRVRPD